MELPLRTVRLPPTARRRVAQEQAARQLVALHRVDLKVPLQRRAAPRLADPGGLLPRPIVRQREQRGPAVRVRRPAVVLQPLGGVLQPVVGRIPRPQRRRRSSRRYHQNICRVIFGGARLQACRVGTPADVSAGNVQTHRNQVVLLG